MISIETLALIVVTAAMFYYLLDKKWSNYPPGPFAFPIVGNLPQVLFYGSLTKYEQHYRMVYGDVFTFAFGRNRRVVISGYENFHKLLIKSADITSCRSPKNILSESSQDIAKKAPGLFWATYPHWKTLRSFGLSTLREEGMGKSWLEPQIIEEIEHYCSVYIEPNLNKPIKLRQGLSKVTCNIISQLMYAKRFDYEDEVFNKMIQAVNEIISIALKAAITSCLKIPGTDWFLRSTIARERYLAHEVMIPTIQSLIDKHKLGLDKENPRDMTDRFLIHADSAQDSDQLYSDYNGCIFELQLYIAGTETTSTSLQWALLLMCLHPEKKRRVQEEIDSTIGSNRHVTCKDRVNMPYTDAVLFETLRKTNVASSALPHNLDKEVTINGVTIPAGAELLLNMASVLHDETVFEEPEKFKPERYLTGDIALKKKRTIPFGIGRRACLGESLARMEIFLVFTTILQKYDIQLPDGANITEEPDESFVSMPQPHNIIFSRR